MSRQVICVCGHVRDRHRIEPDRDEACSMRQPGSGIVCRCSKFVLADEPCRCGHRAGQHAAAARHGALGVCLDRGNDVRQPCFCAQFRPLQPEHNDRWRGKTDEEFFHDPPS